MKKSDANAHWTETVDGISEVENKMIVLAQRVEVYGYVNLTHIAKITRGNLKAIKEILLFNQSKIVDRLVATKTQGRKKK